MTSTVKYPGDARTGRAVAPLYIGPDAVDAGEIVGGAMELCGGDTEIAPPLAIVDCEASTAVGFVGRASKCPHAAGARGRAHGRWG